MVLSPQVSSAPSIDPVQRFSYDERCSPLEIEMDTKNIDPEEVAKFDQLASTWWDPKGPFKTLHAINPLRFDYINKRTPVENTFLLDVGCGGGILTEAMAKAGANVTGIDLSQGAINTAIMHQRENQFTINYQCMSVDQLANQEPERYDIVTCLEMLEHTPDPSQIIKSCSQCVKPGGHIYFSTINRNIKSYLQAIIGAEYILKLLPKGTHNFARFIRPSELANAARAHHLQVEDTTGISHNLLSQHYFLTTSVDVNYIVHCTKTSS